MNIPIQSIWQKWANLSLPVLTGTVVATAVVIMLVSEKVGAMQLAQWQIAVIYVAIVAACVFLGVKDCAKICAGDNAAANTNSD